MQLFSDEGKKMSALNYKTLQLGDNFTAADIVVQLTATRMWLSAAALTRHLHQPGESARSNHLLPVGTDWNAHGMPYGPVYKTENDKLGKWFT